MKEEGSMRNGSAIIATLSLLAVVAVLGVSQPGGSEQPDDGLPPLYLTIVIHNEEDTHGGGAPKANIPDYDGDEALMHHFAEAMRAFGRMAADHGARINFGSDWTFSHGATLYEPDFYLDLEALGHEIDAHAHESAVLYHEVRDAIALAGGHPTHVASGMNEEEIQSQLAYFDDLAPEFRILWGVSLPGHDAGECTATWVWRPSREDWTVHDPDGRYIYVGHGELMNSLAAIRQAVTDRRADRVNTYAVFVSPREFLAAEGDPGIAAQWTAPTDSIQYWENKLAWWDDFLTQIDVLVDAGVVQYAFLTEIAEVFEALEETLDFSFGDVPRSDLSMRARNVKSGYPLTD